MDKEIIKTQPAILNFICIFLSPKLCVLFHYVSKAMVKILKLDRKEKTKPKEKLYSLHLYDRNSMWWRQTVITITAGSKRSCQNNQITLVVYGGS